MTVAYTRAGQNGAPRQATDETYGTDGTYVGLISPMCPISPIRSLAASTLFARHSDMLTPLLAPGFLLCAWRETALIDAAAINAARIFLILS
jgi:hypothetical protein